MVDKVINELFIKINRNYILELIYYKMENLFRKHLMLLAKKNPLYNTLQVCEDDNLHDSNAKHTAEKLSKTQKGRREIK